MYRLGRGYQKGYYIAVKAQLKFLSMISSWSSTRNYFLLPQSWYYVHCGGPGDIEVNKTESKPLNSQINVM